MNIKRLIPKSIKLQLKKLSTHLKDRWEGRTSQFAKQRKKEYTFPYSISLVQPIKVAPLYENKIKNIERAGQKIDSVVIEPGEIFSFWRIIGEPSKKNGFKKGRNLISGKMSEDYGGGLCQLSGILYHLSLLGGLEIMERYNHSVDFYTEENRYTPIGCDATVVYGYKDLRIKNNLNFPLRFSIEIEKEELSAHLWSASFIKKTALVFDRKDIGDTIEVKSLDDSGKILNHSIYFKKSE